MLPLKNFLYSPGPTQIPPEVLLEMAHPILHHRTPQFSAILDQARERMKPLMGTRQEVILLAASGTGGMEAAVVNVLAPGEAALFVNGGKFGERWGKLLSAFGMKGHELKVEWGRAVEPEQIERALGEHPEIRAVLIQASETSTCALHPVAEIAAITRKRDVMLLVDGITSVGVFAQEMDAWGVDVMVTGSQKALMLPPGLAMVALSPRAWEKAKGNRTRGYYFDLFRERKAQVDEHTTAYTPAVSLICGLNKSLELIERETLDAVFERHRVMAEATRAAAAAIGLKLLAPDHPAPGVTGLLVPESINSSKVVRYMRDTLGVVAQGGQDHMSGKLLRIGHMGYVTPLEILIAVGAMEMGLAREGYRFELGRAVAAAQTRIAQTQVRTAAAA
ncbi:MAG TPA: alanine--glyoxylate aminotransferase family protein [Candidatus Binataceae bacterium]|nr:alanine--glyoxylate aminotransferase family protein [Candidatus Binataceae bacterium]